MLFQLPQFQIVLSQLESEETFWQKMKKWNLSVADRKGQINTPLFRVGSS